LGNVVRRVLLEAGAEEISSPSELFLYLADRAQHIHEVIQPAFARGALVLCDRFTDSTLAYQGYGRGIDLQMLRSLNEVASGGITPELSFLLDCPVEVGLSRATARKLESLNAGKPPSLPASQPPSQDRFEREKVEFHERVRTGFLELARAEPERIYLLDSTRSIQDVHEEIKKIVDAKLEDGQ